MQLLGARIIAFYQGGMQIPAIEYFVDITYDDTDWVRKVRKIYKFMGLLD